MTERRQMFSDSWHRVAGLKAAINPSVEAFRQFFHGEQWYVLRDPLNNDFYRVTPAAWEFAGRLDGKRTVEEVWRECLALDPDHAPGQEEIVQLLAQLHRANLLLTPLPPESARIFERYRQERLKRLRTRLINFLFVHIPLYDPDRLLERLQPLARLFLNPAGALLWLGVVLLGLKAVAENFDAALAQADTIFAPENLLLLYLSTVFIKFFHELGHGLICKRYGGEVHTFGIMLMVFAPLPYLDVTSAWSFRPRYQRILVGAGGMISEFFLAGIAAIVWAGTGDPLVNTVAFQMMFIASVSTLLFNINPLLRFDGYYIFSDLMDLPNLYQRATGQLKYLFERHAFNVKAAFSPARNRRETVWLTLYGVASLLYRIGLLAVITFVVAESFLGVGRALAIVVVGIYFVLPILKFLRYLFTSPRLERARPRALSVTALALVAVLGFLGLFPFPRWFTAPGVVRAAEVHRVFADSEGYVTAVLVRSGEQVRAGDTLIRLRNPELELQLEAARARLRQINDQIGNIRQRNDNVLISPLRQELAAIRMLMEALDTIRTDLEVRAQADGIWFSPGSRDLEAGWMARGTQIGMIISPRNMEFIAVVPQDEAANLFTGTLRGSEVRLRGEAGTPLPVASQRIIPAQQRRLPSAALGRAAGGPVEIRRDDDSGTIAVEPFFEVRADLAPGAGATLLHDRTGRIRFDLEPEPLLTQLVRILRQTLQRRLQT